jgi:hypothetical protein
MPAIFWQPARIVKRVVRGHGPLLRLAVHVLAIRKTRYKKKSLT